MSHIVYPLNKIHPGKSTLLDVSCKSLFFSWGYLIRFPNKLIYLASIARNQKGVNKTVQFLTWGSTLWENEWTEQKFKYSKCGKCHFPQAILRQKQNPINSLDARAQHISQVQSPSLTSKILKTNNKFI